MTSKSLKGTKSKIEIFAEFPTPELLRDANLQYIPKSETDSNGLPVACPSAVCKRDIFRLEDYAHVDARACEAPPTLRNKPLADLVNYLVQPTQNDELGRVRAIYRWITAQDLSKISGGAAAGRNRTTAMDYLVGIKTKTVSYHTLFQDMCRLVQIETVIVTGFAKHSGYEIGDRFYGKEHEGSWSAVLINGSWHLMDVHWSSMHVSGIVGDWELLDDNGQGAKKVTQDENKVYYQYDESYFMPNPEEFVYTHCAEDPKWQLLARPVSPEEFTLMAFLKPAFFQRQLKMISHTRCVEYAPEGVIKIELGLPPKAEYKFMYKLWISTKGSNQSSYKDLELTRYVFMENAKGKLTCDIQFPIAGRFKLQIFCLDASNSTDETYLWVCDYAVEAEKAKKNAKVYPENSRQEWGPGVDLKNAGLTAITHETGVVELPKGETVVRFEADKDVEILAKMTSSKSSKKNLSRYVIHRVENHQVIINVKVPEPGDYALNLYAKNKTDSKETRYSSVCNYLVSAAEAPADITPFPEVANGSLGPIGDFEKLGMKVLSHPSSYFEAPNNGQVDISFSNPLQADIIADLSLSGEKGDKKFDEFLFLQKKTDSTSMKARFPKKGKYLLNVYGKPKGSAENSYPRIFAYVIVVNQPMKDCTVFPKCYSKWDDSCAMQSPDIGAALVAGTSVPFSVKIPEALKVAVIDSRKTWTELSGDGDGNWKGDVNIEEPGELKLSACYSLESNSYDTLLLFQVKTRSQYTDNDASTTKPEATKPKPDHKTEIPQDHDGDMKKEKERKEKEKQRLEKEAKTKKEEEEKEKEKQRIEKEAKTKKEEEEKEKENQRIEKEAKAKKEEEEKEKEKQRIENEAKTKKEEEEKGKEKQRIEKEAKTKKEEEEKEKEKQIIEKEAKAKKEEEEKGKEKQIIEKDAKTKKKKKKKKENEKQRLEEEAETKNEKEAKEREKQRLDKEAKRKKEEEEKEKERRKREREEKRKKEEQWKQQFLEEQRRTEMGELEYRRQFALSRQPAVQALFQKMGTKTKSDNKMSKTA